MKVMPRVQAFFAFAALGLLFSVSGVASPVTTCVAQPPLKPIHRICGVVFFPSGDRISNAKVTVLQEDKEITAQQTDKDGKFSFDGLKAGRYEIRVWTENGGAYAQVILTRPATKAKRELAVNINLSGSCSSISLVKSKQF
jgi:uncharacterized protein (DUF2141 family)